jgi:hypothetical protein
MAAEDKEQALAPRNLYGDFAKTTTGRDNAFGTIFSYLDYTDARNTAITLFHHNNLGKKVCDKIEENYRIRQQEILDNCPPQYKDDFQNIFRLDIIKQSIHRSLFVSSLNNIAKNLTKFPGIDGVALLKRETDRTGYAVHSTKLTKSSEAPFVARIIAGGYAAYQTEQDFKVAFLLGNQPAMQKKTPDTIQPIIEKIIKLNKVIKLDTSDLSTSLVHSIKCLSEKINSSQFDDYMFALEALMWSDMKNTSAQYTEALSDLSHIKHDSLNLVMPIALGFKNDPNSIVPVSLIFQYFKDAPQEEAQSRWNLWDLVNSFFIPGNDEANNAVIDAANRIPFASRQAVLEAASQFKDEAKPMDRYRAYMISSFGRANRSSLKYYVTAARSIIPTANFDECSRYEVVDALTNIMPEHLITVMSIVEPYFEEHSYDNSFVSCKKLIYSLLKIKHDPLKTSHFEHYISSWNTMKAVLNEDSPVETCIAENGQARSTRCFNPLQSLEDLTNTPPAHLDSVVRMAQFFIQKNPHLKTNQNIISALNQAPMDHIDEYFNAFHQLKDSGCELESYQYQSLLWFLTKTPHEALNEVIENVLKAKAERPNFDFYAMENVIHGAIQKWISDWDAKNFPRRWEQR